MLHLLFVLSVLSCAYGQLHSVCHSNTQQLTEQQVIAQLSDMMDRNADGIITTPEIVLGFRDILNETLPLSDSTILEMNDQALINLALLFGFTIDKDDFIRVWHATFHDSLDFVEAIFDAFDTNPPDGVWFMNEVEGILNMMKQTSDANRDDIITVGEFEHFFTYIYSC